MENSKLDGMNKIQEILIRHKLSSKIELPQIVVIGAQSVGKSSLLELLLDTDILPKGEGIVTRTPILIQSIKVPEKKTMQITFGHLPLQVFEDPEKIKEEIISRTFQLAGQNKSVSEEPIVVKLEGPGVSTLSCIDLPGLTKIPVDGQLT